MTRRFLGLLACAVLMSAVPATAGHLVGGTLSWRLIGTGEGNHVLVTVHVGLKRSAFTGTDTDGRPKVGDVIQEPPAGLNGEAARVEFGDGTMTESPLFLRVEAIDATGDWLLGTATFSHSYFGQGPYTAKLTGCCGPNPSYSIGTLIDLTTRGSAVTSLPMVVYCSFNGQEPCLFKVTGGTAQFGEVIRYRLATQGESGFAAPANVNISSTSGLVTVTPPAQTPQTVSVQLVIDSFRTLNGQVTGNAVASTAIEFILSSQPGTSTANPTFLSPTANTPAEGSDAGCGTTVGVTPGQTYQHIFRGFAGTGAFRLNAVGGVPVSSFGTPLPANYDVTQSNLFTFSPTPEDSGTYVLTAFTTSLGSPPVQRMCSIVLIIHEDRDGDNIPDQWETNGFRGADGLFVDLPGMGAKATHKDIFVYVNAFTDPSDATFTRSLLSKPAIDRAIQAFANAPLTNPDGLPGINLHVMYGNLLMPYDSANSTLSPTGSLFDWTRFDSIKTANMPVRFRQVFHYALFYPYQGGPFPTSTGLARGIPSRDFVVSLGNVARTFRLVQISATRFRSVAETLGGTDEQQLGTFMHELGHDLGLTHGGPDLVADPVQKELPYKPNYLSVMNYAYQLPGIPTTGSTAAFDYSQYAPTEVGTLNESNLNETLGFQVTTPLAFSPDFGVGPRQSAVQRGLLPAWYCMNDSSRQVACRDAAGVLVPGCNANNPANLSCGTTPFLTSVTATVRQSATPGVYQPLMSYNDWAYLNYTGGINAGGVIGVAPKLTSTTDPYNPQKELEIPPNPPTGVTARRSGLSVRVAWNPLGNLNSYRYAVFKKVNGGSFNLLVETAATAISDPVSSGQTVQYYVNATNGASVTSANSAIVTVVVP